MLRRVYIVVKNTNNPTITVNDQPYNYGDTYKEGSVLNIRVTASKYSEYNQRVTVSNSNLIINIELMASGSSGNFVDLTSDQSITGVKTFEGNNPIIRFKETKWLEDSKPDSTYSRIVNAAASGSVVGDIFLYNEIHEDSTNEIGAQLRAKDMFGAVFGMYRQYNRHTENVTYGVTASRKVKDAIANWSFPSNDIITLTPTNGGKYSMAWAGYYCLYGTSTAANQYININTQNWLDSACFASTSGCGLRVFAPTLKNQNITIDYNVTKDLYFKFIKANSDVE